MADGPLLASPDYPASLHTSLHRLFEARGGFARALVCSDVAGMRHCLSHSAVCRRDATGHWLGYRGITRDFATSITTQLAQRQAARLLAAGVGAGVGATHRTGRQPPAGPGQ